MIKNSSTKKIIINSKSDINIAKKHIVKTLFICIVFNLVVVYMTKYFYKIEIDKKFKKNFKKITINKAFVICASIIGITFSILYPLYQIPDELTHINMIYSERNLKINFVDINHGYGKTEKIMTNPNEIVKYDKYFDLSKKIDYGFKFKIPSITVIRHLPQAIGMMIGEILHLPVLLFITTCELCALFFYIFICNKALKKMPYKKNLLMLIMLLPVCAQQMASFSYDVVLNCICFLFISTIFDIKFSKKKINGKDLLSLLIMLLIIGICKIPYILLGFLLLLLPYKKLEIKFQKRTIKYNDIKAFIKKHKRIFSVILFILIPLSLFITYKILIKISIGRVLIASIIHPISTLKLYIRTLKLHIGTYFETIVGNLGWFDVKVSILFEIFVYLSLFIFTFNNLNVLKNKFKKWELITIYLFFFIFAYIIILSMFEWTLMCTNIPNYNKLSVEQLANYIKIIPYIGGVQGRYFIPIIPVILFPLNSEKISNKLLKINPLFYNLIYFIIYFVYLTVVLLNRYWI